MNRSIRTFWLLALGAVLIAMGSLLAACGESGGDNPSPSTSPSTTPAASTSVSVSPLASVTPSASPSPIDAASMSEEEMAGATEQAATKTATATQTASQTMSTAAGDGEVTEAEAQQLKVSIANAEQLVGYTESILDAYEQTYAVYASATVDQLEQLSMYLTDIDEELGTILTMIEDAQTNAQTLADTMKEAAQRARESAKQLIGQASDWADATTAAVKAQVATAQEAAATRIAETKAGALKAAGVYVQTLGRALISGAKLTQQELNTIYSASADAVASLKQQGGTLAAIGDKIQEVTRLLAGGQLPQIRSLLPQIESMLP